MADIGTLAPLIIGGAAGIGGIITLLWMNHNRPQLQIEASSSRPEEEAQPPFSYRGADPDRFTRLAGALVTTIIKRDAQGRFESVSASGKKSIASSSRRTRVDQNNS